MAKQQAVWGIDIGQCALKALRCVLGDDGQVNAVAYDYIPYPKSLSQPDAQPEEIVRESLQQFLSRNRVRGDKVAMSVSGQSGLARFFRPPGADPKLLPSLVKYEAKQQIPFQIDEVVWDWQQIGGYVADGNLSEAEVGLFAMKRETVYRSMQPFIDAGVEVDFVQLSPIATFNMICHDMLDEIPNPEEIDPENPPPYHLIISIGTDSTDVVVTNGNRLWLRNIALGGNHFTKQLSRELKLTHAKAEQLKRNARKAENPKELFKAMRPVFSDMGDELARSLNFFRSIDRNAEFNKVLLMGNASLLPGLRQYLETQIDMKIDRFGGFNKLTGDDVMSQKSFLANVRSFAPCYGLCIQALEQSKLTTNLLPQEFIVEKIVRAKKPWVLSAVSLVMLGVAVGHALGANYQYKTDKEFVDEKGVSWQEAIDAAKAVKTKSGNFLNDDQTRKLKLQSINKLLDTDLVGPTYEKDQMLQLQTVVSQLVPKDRRVIDRSQTASKDYPYNGREDIYIDQLVTLHYNNPSEWFDEETQKKFTRAYSELHRKRRPGEKNPVDGLKSDAPVIEAGPEETGDEDEQGMVDNSEQEDAGNSGPDVLGQAPGYVIHLKGHHYANGRNREVEQLKTGGDFINHSFVRNFFDKEIVFQGEKYLPSDFGIAYPTIMKQETAKFQVPNQGVVEAGPGTVSGNGAGGVAAAGGDDKEGEGGSRMQSPGGRGGSKAAAATANEVQKTAFEVEFLWRPITIAEVKKNRDARIKKEQDILKAREEAKKQKEDGQADSGEGS